MPTKPSGLRKPETFARIPVAALQRYLVSRGWRQVHVEHDRDIRWFYHDRMPAIPTNYRLSTRPPGYMSAHMVPCDIDVPDRQWLVKTIPQHFLDYVHAVFDLLEDLERHEDRWLGAILDDVLTFVDADADNASDPAGDTQRGRFRAEPLSNEEFAAIRDSWWTRTGGDINVSRLVATVSADRDTIATLREELRFVTERLMEKCGWE